MKKFWSLFLCMTLAAGLLAGCGDAKEAAPEKEASGKEETGKEETEKETPEKEASGEEGEPIEIVYWQMPTHDDIVPDMEAVAKRFQEEVAPNVTVRIETVAAADLQNKVQTAIMVGEQPDILRDQIGRTGIYMQQGLLAPFDIFTEEYQQNFHESTLAQGMMDGKVYIYPECSDYYGMVINKTLFEEAGAEGLLPQNEERTWTREEFEKAIAAVTDEEKGVYGTGFFSANEQSDINTKILIEGGKSSSLYNEDFTKVLYDSPENIQGLEWMLGLNEKGYVYPGVHTLVDDDVWALFGQKKVAALPANFWAKAWVEERLETGEIQEPFEIMLTQYPNKEGDTPKTAAPMTGYAVFDKGDPAKIEAAQKFVDYMMHSEERQKHIKLQSMFPALKEMDSMYESDAELSWASAVLADYVYDAGFATETFGEIRMALYPEIQAAFAGSKTAEQAMKDFTAKANEILGK